MKNTFLGFNQYEACKLGLSIEELAALRWFIDFSQSPKMKKYIDEEHNVYYWINYKYFAQECPILFKNKENPSEASIRNKVQRLFNGNLTKVLDKKIIKITTSSNKGKVGTEVYYKTNINFDKLLSDNYKYNFKSKQYDNSKMSSEYDNSKMSSEYDNSKMSSEYDNSKMSSNYYTNDSSFNDYITNDKTTTIDNGSSDDFDLVRYLEEHNFSMAMISPDTLKLIYADIEIFSLDEVKEAIKIADQSGKHTYRYYRGILKNRRAQGDNSKKGVKSDGDRTNRDDFGEQLRREGIGLTFEEFE